MQHSDVRPIPCPLKCPRTHSRTAYDEEYAFVRKFSHPSVSVKDAKPCSSRQKFFGHLHRFSSDDVIRCYILVFSVRLVSSPTESCQGQLIHYRRQIVFEIQHFRVSLGVFSWELHGFEKMLQ